MGAVGGLVGLNGGMNGTGYTAPSGTSAGQLNTAYNGAQTAMGDQGALLTALQGQNGLGNQNQVYGQLQGIANGTGPNPAQAMLNQSTGQNVANQAALMAGQRGAAGNVGLMARQAAQTGAGIQQQAAGQGASMQAQQALNAVNSAGQMANTQAANQIGQTNANVQAQQGEQSTLQGANTANNAVQGQLANTTMQGQQALIGGGMQAGAAAMGLAQGGTVGYADGGITANSAFGPQSMFGQALNTSSAVGQTPTFGSEGTNPIQTSFDNISKGIAKKKAAAQQPPKPTQKPTQDPAQAPATAPTPDQAPVAPLSGASSISDSGGLFQKIAPLAMMAAAQGGQVPAVVSPGEHRIPKEAVPAVASGKVSPLKVGETFPGKPKVKGNDYQNDTIQKSLPVGDFIIPNSVMQSKDPEKNAAKFVRDYLAKKGKRA